MSAYCAQADVNLDLTRLAELTDSAAAVGVIDSVVVESVLEDAARELDSYIEGQYVVPVTGTIPNILRVWSAAIAAYRFYRRRAEMDCPAIVAREYERTIALVAKAGTVNGVKIPIARANGVLPPLSSAATVTRSTSDTRRNFGRDRDGIS